MLVCLGRELVNLFLEKLSNFLQLIDISQGLTIYMDLKGNDCSITQSFIYLPIAIHQIRQQLDLTET